jgi:hypothetical protein
MTNEKLKELLEMWFFSMTDSDVEVEDPGTGQVAGIILLPGDDLAGTLSVEVQP